MRSMHALSSHVRNAYPMPAMLISAIVIVAYTTLGGFLAASTTDFVQSIVMTIAIVVVFGFGISKSAVSVPLWTMQNPWPDTSA